jgi:tRNA-splicing ligase RtcB
MDAMLSGGAAWAVSRGYGLAADLERIEERGCVAGAEPGVVSDRAKRRQRGQMGTLGSGNHYLEVQRVTEIFAPEIAAAFGIREGDALVSIHCGSRGLGHQIGTEFLKEMAIEAPNHGIYLPDRELACAPVHSPLGRKYLGAMRAAINCALGNRQIITHLTRAAFAEVLPKAELELIYDVSHNTCKEERHEAGGRERTLFVHRKGATRAFGPGHPQLPAALRPVGQPVLIGGTMGTASYILAGTDRSEALSFSSSCHGAGRQMSRHRATRLWKGREVVDELARQGMIVKCPTLRGVAEEAPGAYKDVREVVEAAERSGIARRAARVEPMICVKG